MAFTWRSSRRASHPITSGRRTPFTSSPAALQSSACPSASAACRSGRRNQVDRRARRKGARVCDDVECNQSWGQKSVFNALFSHHGVPKLGDRRLPDVNLEDAGSVDRVESRLHICRAKGRLGAIRAQANLRGWVGGSGEEGKGLRRLAGVAGLTPRRSMLKWSRAFCRDCWK